MLSAGFTRICKSACLSDDAELETDFKGPGSTCTMYHLQNEPEHDAWPCVALQLQAIECSPTFLTLLPMDHAFGTPHYP